MAGMNVLAPITDHLDIQTTLVFTCVFLIAYIFMTRSGKKQPPGPMPLPVIGNAMQVVGADPAKRLMKLREKYGDIITLKVGMMTMIVVFGHKMIREALIDKADSFINRPNWVYFIEKIFSNRGVFWGNGENWKMLRKFTIVALRDFGVGKKTLEQRIQDEARIVGEELGRLKEKPFQMKKYFADAVANIIGGIVFGQRSEYSDPDFQRLLGYLDYLFKHAGMQVPENFFPWLTYIREYGPTRQMLHNDKKIHEYVDSRIEEHRKDFDPDNIRDFIDLYLKGCLDKEIDKKEFSEHDLYRVIVDLFLAGSEATATAIVWFFLYMVRFPKIQQQYREEIEKVVGTGRPVGLADKQNLPYVCGTINEILRLSSVAPLVAPHSVSKTVELGGYHLEKDWIVLFHSNSAHMDPTYWDNPEEFRPERWIGPDGKLIKHSAFMPFSIGPRSCLGEILANMELFLFGSNLIQRFRFTHPTGTEPPSLEGVQTGITMQPHPYEMVAIPR